MNMISRDERKNQKGYTPIKDILVESFNQLEELYNRKQWF